MAVHDPIPRPGQVPQVRLTHADRDQAAERLQEAYADGRLDEEELDERLSVAMKAKFPADLEPLFRDLAVPGSSAAAAPHMPQAPAAPEAPPSGEDKVWAGAAHASGYFMLPVGPLLVLLLRGNTSPFVRRHAMEALNYQLTVVVGSIIGFGLFFLVIPALAATLMLMGWLFLPAIAGLVALMGGRWRYPLTWRPVKDG